MIARNTLQSDAIFGPVPSRRLGRSLGVDLVPLKTCPYDWFYYRGLHTEGEFVVCQADILALVKRRPCSVADIASGLNLHRNHVIKSVQSLVTQRRIKAVLRHETVFYQIQKNVV
jgi:hypothetical protein